MGIPFAHVHADQYLIARGYENRHGLRVMVGSVEERAGLAWTLELHEVHDRAPSQNDRDTFSIIIGACNEEDTILGVLRRMQAVVTLLVSLDTADAFKDVLSQAEGATPDLPRLPGIDSSIFNSRHDSVTVVSSSGNIFTSHSLPAGNLAPCSLHPYLTYSNSLRSWKHV